MSKRLLWICALLFLLPIVHAQINTSLYASKFNVAAANFSSSTYVTIHTELINISQPNYTFVLLSAFNLKKISGVGIGAENTVYVRYLHDGSTILDERARTLQSLADEGAVIVSPVLQVEGSNVSHVHNITMQVRRSGLGVVEINDIDLIYLLLSTTANGTVYGQVVNGTFLHSSTNLISAFNWTFNKGIGSPSFTTLKQTINGSFLTNAQTQYKMEDFNDNNTSPYYARWLADTADVGSMGMHWLELDEDPGAHSHTILARATTTPGVATIQANVTIFDMDLRDNNSNLIPSFFTTRNDTNISNFVLWNGTGTYNVLNHTLTLRNGTSVFLAMSSTFGTTTGTQTPVYFVNASNAPQAVCYSKKERYINSATDIGNAVIYTICTNLTPGNTYTFNLWVTVPQPGQQVTQLDEAFMGFETETNLNFTAVNLPPLSNPIVTPANGSCARGLINISWIPFSDPNGDNITYNVSLYYPNGTFNQTINGSTNLTNQSFDTTTVPDGNWTIFVEGCDTGGLCANTSSNFTIDNTLPNVTIISPVAGSSYTFLEYVNISVNVTDNIRVGNVTANITLPNGTVQQLTLVNATGNPTGGVYNASYLIPSLNGQYNITIIAYDTCAGNVNASETTYFSTINMSVIKTAVPDPVNAGSQLNYTIIVNNTGNGTAYNLTIVDLYPSGVVFDSASPPPDVGNNTWNFTNLTGGSFIEINITVNVSGSLGNGTILINTVNLSYYDTHEDYSIVTATEITVTSGAPAIYVIKTANPDPVNPGGILVYTINVSNLGDTSASNVTVIETENANETTFINASPSPTLPNTTWVFASMPAFSTQLINITKLVNSSLVDGTVITNSVTVTYNGNSTNTSKNTTVEGFPIITITKSDSPDPVVTDSQLTYTVLIQNTGTGPALDLILTELYPSGVVFDSSSPSPSSGNNSWNLGTLGYGNSTSVTITVNVTAPAGTVLNDTVNLTFKNETCTEEVCESAEASALTTVTSAPPPPTGGGGGGGATRGFQAAPLCLNGTYVQEGANVYGPLCCPPNGDVYCQTMGSAWYCELVSGKTFGVCRLPEGQPLPPASIPEQAEESPPVVAEKSLPPEGIPYEPVPGPVLVRVPEQKSYSLLIGALVAIALALGAVFYFVRSVPKHGRRH
ncbi:DUF11 domain-containing protein [Candidatus Woesearchaeota archaeon]|nr:DUF11 domain-containing protein [Candidatus Woesearchaeota archaeon]